MSNEGGFLLQNLCEVEKRQMTQISLGEGISKAGRLAPFLEEICHLLQRGWGDFY
jgi:hypothetical protein